MQDTFFIIGNLQRSQVNAIKKQLFHIGRIVLCQFFRYDMLHLMSHNSVIQISIILAQSHVIFTGLMQMFLIFLV